MLLCSMIVRAYDGQLLSDQCPWTELSAIYLLLWIAACSFGWEPCDDCRELSMGNKVTIPLTPYKTSFVLGLNHRLSLFLWIAACSFGWRPSDAYDDRKLSMENKVLTPLTLYKTPFVPARDKCGCLFPLPHKTWWLTFVIWSISL